MAQLSLRHKATIMDEAAIMRALRRLSHEIIERNKGVENTVIVGIQKRGANLAEMLAEELYRIEGIFVPVGSIDVTYYRDDLSTANVSPTVGGTHIPFDINNKNVILVDDVICTGRTVRAAIDGLFRLARPSKVQLLVMIDRGLRELPFKPDFVGKNIPTSHSELVAVRLVPSDGEGSVDIYEKSED